MSEERSRQLFEQWIESGRDGCPVDRRPDGEYEYEPARTAWPLWCKLVAIVGVKIDATSPDTDGKCGRCGRYRGGP